jgi:hypothetical protein
MFTTPKLFIYFTFYNTATRYRQQGDLTSLPSSFKEGNLAKKLIKCSYLYFCYSTYKCIKYVTFHSSQQYITTQFLNFLMDSAIFNILLSLIW